MDTTLKRCKRLKCHVCKRPHAPLGCKRMGCRKTYHQPCAIKANCVFDEESFTISCFVCDEVMKARERKKRRLEEEKKKKRDEAKARKMKTKKRRQIKQKKKSKSSKKRKALEPRPHNQPEKTVYCESSEEEEEEEVHVDSVSPVKKVNPVLLRLRPVVSDLFKRLRKDDLPVQKVHDALTEFDVAMGRPKTSRADLDVALRELEEENRIMYREYDGAWTVFLI